MKHDLIQRLVTFGICIISLGHSFAQTLPDEPMGKFVRNGVVYWHKDLPYYIAIDDDSAGTESIMLHSKHQAKYSNPAYFDTYGWNYIRTRWAVDQKTHQKAVPEQEIVWEVYVDGEAPATKPTFLSKSAYLVNGVRYFASDLMMQLDASDKDSGVRSTYYSIDDLVWIKYERPLKLNPKDPFRVRFFSCDNVGNMEKIKHFAYLADDYNVKYAVDANPPVTELITKFKNDKYVGVNTEFVFTAKDKGSGVALTNYQIDQDSLQRYDAPFTINVKPGWHTIKWFSVDWVTNKEITHEKRFIFDINAPNVFVSALGSYFSKDSIMFMGDTTSIKIIANDVHGISRIAFKLTEDKAYQEYTGPVRLPRKYKPRQDLKYFAQDSIGNESEVYVMRLERDVWKPRVNFLITGDQFVRGDTTYVTNRTHFATFNYDTLSGIGKDRVYVNGKRMKPTADRPSGHVSFDKSGAYSIVDSVWDNVGNLNAKSQFFKCDLDAPNIEFHFSNPQLSDNQYPAGVILFLAITDDTGVKSYKTIINNKEFVGTNFHGKPGSYQVDVTAIDQLGQVNSKSTTFVIK